MALKRTHTGIFGTTNSGKSTLMNLLTAHDFSIVDNTAGTTADVKVTVMQFHELGPVKLMDTAGIDESTGLGEKKRIKTFRALRESDIVIIVIDPFRSEKLNWPEKDLFHLIDKKQVFLLFNHFSQRDSKEVFDKQCSLFTKEFSAEIKAIENSGHSSIDSMSADLASDSSRRLIVDFICSKAAPAGKKVPLIPNIHPDRYLLMVIPMDEETPEGRLLRPQALSLENSIRQFAPVVCYRPDLGLARNGTPAQKEAEKNRYLELVRHLETGPYPLQLVITDSQAMDCIGPWTPEHTELTTFSIMMINRQLDNDLKPMIEGARALAQLKAGDKVLIVEACNHDRKAEDIGTVQLPNLIHQNISPDITFEYAFGREFPFERLHEFKAAIHCGGCMVEPQKVSDRIGELLKQNVPVTNYGVALTYLKSPELMEKVIKPFIQH
jgi:small GTP-binding protein